MATLLAPLIYLRVKQPMKRRYDLVIPSAGALSLTGLLIVWPGHASIFGSEGFLHNLQSLFAILGGFFVAALTLLSTSDSPVLKAPLAGWPAATLRGIDGPLSRKRFLCLLFGYLAFSAFSLYAIGMVAMLIAPGLKPLVAPAWRSPISAAFLLPYGFWLTHMFISTLIGLYYFTDRLQRPDNTILEKERQRVSAE